jgi:hypothetical protein
MSTLTNSIVRGFGLTLGRKAANAVTSPSRVQSVEQVSFSKKQLELIQNYEGIINNINNVKSRAKESLSNGNLTDVEYEILMSQADTQLVKATAELDKVKSVQPKSSSSVMKWILIIFVGIPLVLAILSGLFN